jgi:hypothetical protein
MSTYQPAFPKPGKKRKTKPDETFRLRYRELPCLLCECPDTAYCHYPRHRGSGGRMSWEYNAGVPLCLFHHDLIDGRRGTSSWGDKDAARERLSELAPAFWERMRQEYGL